MAGRNHSRATKLAATFLARLVSADVAAATFRIDVRTVRSWQAGGVELPYEEWTAIRDVLRARAAEMAATGTTAGLVQTMTAAGIADRNVRYSTLIARREQRHAPESDPEPVKPAWLAAVEALDEMRGHLLGAELRHELRDRADEDPAPGTDAPSAEGDAAMLAWVEAIAALSDDQARDRLLAIEPEWGSRYGGQSPATALRDAILDRLDAIGPVAALRDAIDAIDGPAGDGAPGIAASMTPDTPPAGPTPPEPSQRALQPAPRVNVGLHVVTDDEAREYDGDRHLWHSYER